MRMLTALFLLAFLVQPAQAVGVVLVDNDHHPLPTLFEYDVLVYLEQNRPADTHLYAVMAYDFNENGEFVSLAGLAPDTQPPYYWRLEDGNVIWIGTLTRIDGAIQLYQPGAIAMNAKTPGLGKTLEAGPGGGVDIYLPWQAGKKMMFGSRAVHGGGFSVSNSIGLDWVGGDDFGADAASATVYASASGEVTAVCTDGTSAAYLVEGGGNQIAYFHLEIDNLIGMGDTVARGQPIGSLVYGNFDDTCGWASQQPDHYHLHWVVVPANNRFRAEGWTLDTTTARWTRGNETIRTGQWVTGGGGFGSLDNGEDDPASGPGSVVITPGDPEMSGGGGAHLWDYVVIGLNQMYTTFKGYYVPEDYSTEDSDELFRVSENMMRTMIQDWNIILVNDVINLTPWFILIGVILGAEVVRWVMITVLFGFNIVGMLRSTFKWW